MAEPAQTAADRADAADGASSLHKALGFYSAYGWNARIGLITPSTNTTLEPELNRMAPEGVAIHASRIYQAGAQQPASYRRMADDVGTAVDLLATAEVDVIAFGCTSCTYFVAPDEIRDTIAAHASCPAVLTADAVVAALQELQVRRVALIGPRTRYVTDREVAFLESAGFEVVSSACLGLGATEEERRAIGRVPPQSIFRLAREANRPTADAIFVSCTQLPTVGLIATLEQTFGKPLVSSNQATLWRCLRTVGVTQRAPGFGQLLTDH
ncbi:MAG TPA: decarboxylase [Candidatus Limnocylindria bacterium]|nr:decarboxylase [Candidatus Limnocylindria bacterium]